MLFEVFSPASLFFVCKSSSFLVDKDVCFSG